MSGSSGNEESGAGGSQSNEGDHRTATARVHIVLGVVAVLFSINYIFGKIALRDFNPFAFAWLRVTGSALCLLLIAGRAHAPALVRIGRRDLRRLVLYSLLGVVFNQLLFISGLALTSAHQAAILITTIPIFTLAAALLLGRERATLRRLAGIIVAAAGAILIIGVPGGSDAHSSVGGNILILLNCASYGVYLVLSRPLLLRMQAVRVITMIFGLAVVLMFPFSLPGLLVQDWGTIGGEAWFALAVVVLGPTVGAYLLNAWALARTDSSVVAAYTYLQPFIASLLAAAFLDETIGAMTFIAALLIIAGVYLAGRSAPLPREA